MGDDGMSDLVERFEFAKPYEASFSDGLQCRWLRLNYNGMLVASFSVDVWGSEQACIEAAWNYAYGVKDDSNDMIDRIEQLERELAQWRENYGKLGLAMEAEKALGDRLDGGLKVSQDIIEAASKLLTKKSGTKWGLWYIDRITELREAYRKARGL